MAYRIRGLLSVRPMGQAGGGGGCFLEILGGWVSKPPPFPVGVGRFLLNGADGFTARMYLVGSPVLSCTFLVPFCSMVPLKRIRHAWSCGFDASTKS